MNGSLNFKWTEKKTWKLNNSSEFESDYYCAFRHFSIIFVFGGWVTQNMRLVRYD